MDNPLLHYSEIIKHHKGLYSVSNKINGIIIISLCIKRQSTGQQPRQPNARRAARPEIEFLSNHRLCETSSEFLRSCNVGPRTASNEPCWRSNGSVQF